MIQSSTPPSPSPSTPPQSPEDILKRVERETETLLSSSLAKNASAKIKGVGSRVGGHFAGYDAVEEGLGHDPIEVWGRRIGRFLSLIGVIVLGYMLYINMKM
jgi:hypothetical protein